MNTQKIKSLKTIMIRAIFFVAVTLLCWWMFMLPLKANKNFYITINFSEKYQLPLKNEKYANLYFSDVEYIVQYMRSNKKNIKWFTPGLTNLMKELFADNPEQIQFADSLERVIVVNDAISNGKLLKKFKNGVNINLLRDSLIISPGIEYRFFNEDKLYGQYGRLLLWILSSVTLSPLMLWILSRLYPKSF